MGWARQTDCVCGPRVGAIIRPPDESPYLTLRIAGSALDVRFRRVTGHHVEYWNGPSKNHRYTLCRGSFDSSWHFVVHSRRLERIVLSHWNAIAGLSWFLRRTFRFG